MKWLKTGLFVAVACAFLQVASVGALDTEPYVPPPNLAASPVVVTGYSLANAQLEYVQLFNNSDTPVNLAGWKLEYYVASQLTPALVVPLSSWIAPLNYVVAAEGEADFAYALANMNGELPKELRVVPPEGSGFASGILTVMSGERQRNKSESTGKYTATSAFVVVATSGEVQYGGGYFNNGMTLYGGGFYDFPAQTWLQVSEIVANPRKCSPLETAPDCGDYVKLHNPTTQPIDLSLFRLRVGYRGQNATSSNTFALSGEVRPGQYAVVAHDFDGKLVSVTNSGGFVWLEDTYGIERYDNTTTEYPDASAASKKGWAWAYDASDGTWKWTSQPTPSNDPSVFVLPPPKKKATTKGLVPCKENQYRSEETNRCRTVASVGSSLTPCKPGQERNPATNRCRSVLGASTKLTPCKPGQERNPETNRCRNVVKNIPEAAFAVEPVAEAGKAFLGWWALGGVGALAVGYGAWEWRREVWGGIRKVGLFFSSNK